MRGSTMVRGALAATMLAIAVGATPAGAANAPSDAWLTMKSKMALLTTEDVHGLGINVDTTDGTVTLHGKVQSPDEKSRAEKAVRSVEGVKQVRNLLQVVPEKREAGARVADDQLDDRVKAALDKDKSLADSDIDVESVHDGVVLLGGSAKTEADHLRAIEVASRVDGVRHVRSDIDAEARDQARRDDPKTDAKTDAAKSKGDGRAATDDGYDLGDRASDASITAATKLRLMADDKTPALAINVDTRDGVVTLFGDVPNAEAKRAAEADARKVDGVKHVRNELQVVPEQRDAR
jgi:osmotically-inducible protein OsmY